MATPQENLFSIDLELKTHITRKIMQQGEVSGFNGKMIGNLGITYEKC